MHGPFPHFRDGLNLRALAARLARNDIKIVSRIASNNVEVGNLDAQLVLKSVPKGSDVAVIEGDPVTTSSMDRVKGFTVAAKQGGLNIVASEPASWDRKKARELATKMLANYPNLKAISSQTTIWR